MIRFAIFTAVSSARQADKDKVSLDIQEDASRARGLAKGWRETAGPFIIPGASRTLYVNLRDAEEAIVNKDGSHPLRDMLDSAQRGEYDVLIIYDFTRLRELIDPVARALASYGVQVYSVNQAIDPVPVQEFKKTLSGAASLLQSVSVITSRSEIETMTRRLHSAVEARIPKGLHPAGPRPYGYRYAPVLDPQKVPFVIDPPKAAIVVKIKDLYLSGLGIPQVIAYLEQHNIPAPNGGRRWADYSVRYILKNPFYAGLVRLGNFRMTHDPRNGTKKPVKGAEEQVVYHQGLHEPLWDMATHRALVEENRRRGKNNKGQKTYRLSNLLKCPEHGRTFYVHYQRGLRDDAHRLWYCPVSDGKWHAFMMDSDILQKLTARLVSDLQDVAGEISLPEPEDRTAVLETAVKDLRARRERLTDALETGNLDPATYAERKARIDTRLAEISAELKQAMAARLDLFNRNENLTLLARTLIETPEYIAQAPPQLVNQQLRNLIETVHVFEDHEIKIIYR